MVWHPSVSANHDILAVVALQDDSMYRSKRNLV